MTASPQNSQPPNNISEAGMTTDEVQRTEHLDTLSRLKSEASSNAAGLGSLEERWSSMDYSLQELIGRVNAIEQYMRINSLLFHGFPPIPKGLHGRALKKFIVDTINNLFPNLQGGPVQLNEVEYGHTLRTRKNIKHVAIVKFSCRFTKDELFFSKTSLSKDSGVFISEHLTAFNQKLLSAAKSIVGDKNAWSAKTKIWALVNGNKVPIVDYYDIKRLRRDTGAY